MHISLTFYYPRAILLVFLNLKLISGKCGTCAKPVTLEGCTAFGKVYHKECFKCCVCRKRIDGKFFEKNGKPYCSKDFEVICLIMTSRVFLQKTTSHTFFQSHPILSNYCYDILALPISIYLKKTPVFAIIWLLLSLLLRLVKSWRQSHKRNSFNKD